MQCKMMRFLLERFLWQWCGEQDRFEKLQKTSCGRSGKKLCSEVERRRQLWNLFERQSQRDLGGGEGMERYPTQSLYFTEKD